MRLVGSSGLHNGSGLPSSDLRMESVGTERSGRQTAAESPLVVRPDTGPACSWPLWSSPVIRITSLFTLPFYLTLPQMRQFSHSPSPENNYRAFEVVAPSGPRGDCHSNNRVPRTPSPRSFPLCKEAHCPETLPISLWGCELYLPVTSRVAPSSLKNGINSYSLLRPEIKINLMASAWFQELRRGQLDAL